MITDRRKAGLGLAAAILAASLASSIANVALPQLSRAFGVGFAAAQWVVLAYLLGVTSLIVGVGRLGDMFGRQRLLLAGTGLFVVASLASAATPGLALLIVLRGLQGVGAAAMMALGMALVGDLAPKARTGAAMGLVAGTNAVGTALGPSLGGLLISLAGWRAVFVAPALIGLIALVLIRAGLAKDAAPKAEGRRRFDLPGTILLAAGLAAYALAMTVRSGAAVSAGLILLAAVVLGLFADSQRRSASPLVPLSLLRTPGLAPALGASLAVSAVAMSTLVVGPFYLARGLGLSPALVGLTMTLGPATSALMSGPGGWLCDRFGARRTALTGLALMSLGAAGLAGARFGVAGYGAGLMVLTAGYATFQTANTAGVMAGSAAEARGVTSALLNLSRYLGLVTGAAGLGAVFAAVAGDPATASPQALARGLAAAFAAATGLAVVAFALVASGRGAQGRTA